MTGAGDDERLDMGAVTQQQAAVARPSLLWADLLTTDAADRLHDGPVQSLVAARYAVDLAARGGDASLARDAVQQALVELRAALWHLRPRTGDDHDLAEALTQLSEQLARDGRPVLSLDLESGSPAAFAAAAFRLVQAVALPEGAQPVEVVVRRTANAWTLTVTGGSPLNDAEQWLAATEALGGRLRTAEALHLDFPLDPIPPEVPS